MSSVENLETVVVHECAQCGRRTEDVAAGWYVVRANFCMHCGTKLPDVQ